METLKTINQWTLWKNKIQMTRKNRPGKVPVGKNGRAISILNTNNWLSFDDAMTTYLQNTDKFDGVGFIFTENDPYVGVDIDAARAMNGWQEIIEKFASYTERSPSKKGVHIITKGYVPGNHAIKVGDHEHGEIAMYDAKRYFTFTLDTIKGFEIVRPNQPAIDWLAKTLDDKMLITTITRKEYRNNFIELYEGRWSHKYPSQSEADLAFCRILANNNAPMHQIDRIFRQTKLMRSKWNEKRGNETYGLMTLKKALKD